MQKKALALFFALLLLVLVGNQSFDVVYSNFVPTSPDPTPPKISVISPANQTYENNVLLHFNITVVYNQWINHVEYTLDRQKYLVYSGGIKTGNWSTILEGLSEGLHSLNVAASCKSYYMTSTSGGNQYYRIYGTSSEVINFNVVYPPQISILSLENKTYETDTVPLDFVVNEPTSKIEYCLDGKDRMVIDGNLTLTGLSDGLHNVTVYATDVDGYIGVSETSSFFIDTFPESIVMASVIVVTVVLIGLGLLISRIKEK